MKKIEMVDLRSQYERLKADIDSAVAGVLSSTAFIKGPDVRLFEEELQRYLGVRNVISCANGTDALQIAMMALGLRPGDEVITTNFTFIATAEVIELLGLKTVLVEPDPGTFNISVDAVRKAITPHTRAIVPVHLFGQCADMEPLLALAREHGIYIIEDAAQATGAVYRFSDGTEKIAGTMGTIGCTSFFPSKNLGCYGDGGALFTDNDELAALVRSITNHGMKVRYYHDTIGVNSRLDTLQAAILRVKLRHLDGFNEARRKAAAHYDSELAGLPGITIPVRSPFSTHIFHQYTLRIEGAYLHLSYQPDEFPVTSRLCGEVLSLPMHTELDEEQLAWITGCIRSKFN
jgi:dTDP-4-amino-4,6-dideoxygalactose transaminase